MAQLTLLNAGTGAITAGNQASFRVPAYAFRHNAKPSIIAQGIDSTETITFWASDGSGWQQIYDDKTTPQAAQIDPSNNKTTVTLNTPGMYAITKSSTASAIELKLVF